MNYANAVDSESKHIDPDLFARAWDLTLDLEPWRVPATIQTEAFKPVDEDDPLPRPGTVTRAIYDILTEHGPMTYPELWKRIGREAGVSSKLQVLLKRGMVEASGERPNLVWSAVAA